MASMTSSQPPQPVAAGAWVTRWLSPARFGVYLTVAGGDQHLALELYEWNADTSSAILHDLVHVEVGLRNAYNTTLSSKRTTYPQHWTLCGPQVFASVWRTKRRWDRAQERRVNVQVDVNTKPRVHLDRAIREAGGRQAAPGKIVAQLMFGFWRYLSSSAHDVTLWRPYLHPAFPAGTARPAVDIRVGELHEVRNRVAHHEPLLTEDLQRKHTLLLELADLIEPSLAAHIKATTRVPVLLASRPDQVQDEQDPRPQEEESRRSNGDDRVRRGISEPPLPGSPSKSTNPGSEDPGPVTRARGGS